MLYENYLQLQGRAGARQLSDPKLGLNHNLGASPTKTSAPFQLLAPTARQEALNQQQQNLANSVATQSENFDLARHALSQAKSVLNDAIGAVRDKVYVSGQG